MFLSETKQHPVPLSTNIPDQACEAVLPCRIKSLQIELASLAPWGGVSKGEGVGASASKLVLTATDRPSLAPSLGTFLSIKKGAKEYIKFQIPPVGWDLNFNAFLRVFLYGKKRRHSCFATVKEPF